MALADRANQYIDKEKPWIQAKDPAQAEHVVRVCSLGINLFRTLMVYLKPVVPGLTKRAEEFLNVNPLVWSDAETPLVGHPVKQFKSLLERVDSKKVQAMVEDTRSDFSTSTPLEDPNQKEDGLEEIDIELFSKIDLRVARIVKASLVEGADKLLKLQLDLGSEKRNVFSGIRSAYDPEDLDGRLVVVVANLTSFADLPEYQGEILHQGTTNSEYEGVNIDPTSLVGGIIDEVNDPNVSRALVA